MGQRELTAPLEEKKGRQKPVFTEFVGLVCVSRCYEKVDVFESSPSVVEMDVKVLI